MADYLAMLVHSHAMQDDFQGEESSRPGHGAIGKVRFAGQAPMNLSMASVSGPGKPTCESMSP